MNRGLLDPKMDFIFKKIFGSNENKSILISFLNATLKSDDKIKDVKIDNTDIEKNFLEDKFSRLDIKATTDLNEKINIEIHFIEIPKLAENSDEHDMLVAWVSFLKDPESEKVKNIENNVAEIKNAKNELIKISLDKEQRALYEMRQKVIHDTANALNSALEKGREEGREEAELNTKIAIAKNLIDILDNETISLKTGLSVKAIENLR